MLDLTPERTPKHHRDGTNSNLRLCCNSLALSISSIDISMAEPRIALTRVEFQILLAVLGGATHGYAIMKDVASLTNGALRIGPGTLYTAIKRLLAAGLIEEYQTGSERRRCYRLTRKGRAVGTEEARDLRQLLATARRRGLFPSTS